MSETPNLSTAEKFGSLRRELEAAGFAPDEALSLVRNAFAEQMRCSEGQFVINQTSEPHAGSIVELTFKGILLDNGPDEITVRAVRTPEDIPAWQFNLRRDDPAFVRMVKAAHA